MLEPALSHRRKRRAAVVGLLVVATSFGVLSLRDDEDRPDLVAQSRGTEPAPPPPQTTTTTTTTSPIPESPSSSTTTIAPTTSTTVPRATTTTLTPRPPVSTTTTTARPAAACSGDAPHLPGPGIWTITPTGQAKQLLAHDPAQAYMGPVHWSPDGRHAAYVINGPGTDTARLRVVDLDGHVSAPAGEAPISHAIGWTADSRRVLYTTATRNYPPPYAVTLSAASLGGGPPAAVWEGPWSVFGIQSIDAVADGRVVFVNEDKVFSVHENGTGLTELERVGLPQHGPHYGVPRYLKVSPDGTKLAVAAGAETGIVDLRTGKVIVKGPYQLLVGEWSPDSRWATFTGHASTTLLGADGSVHTIPVAGRDVTFDPHGPTIAIAAMPADPGGAFELLLGPLDGPLQPSLTHTHQVDWGPALVVAVGQRPGGPEPGDQAICTLGDPKPLVRLVGPGSLRDLQWVDSGRLIALTWG